MDRIKEQFGFGLMRLPLIDNKVDITLTKEMVDEFIKHGFNYFDTAHGYLDGESEKVFKACVSSRYDRSEYIVTNKLTGSYFESEADIRPLFYNQLDLCGVSYFDFYLMHAQNKNNFKKFKECKAYETALELKKEGKIRYVGFSFHDSAEVLDMILNEYPEVDVVQLQINYLDWLDPSVQSKSCYEVARKHNKPIIVMEPCKGGALINLPPEAEGIFTLPSASYALRFAASLDGVIMVLSGMSDLSQVKENISIMKSFKKLSSDERERVERVTNIYKSKKVIQCTSCRYCTSECVKSIHIPDLFKVYNDLFMFNLKRDGAYAFHTKNNNKASDCIKCGRCEEACPQKLKIRDLLQEIKKEFE